MSKYVYVQNQFLSTLLFTFTFLLVSLYSLGSLLKKKGCWLKIFITGLYFFICCASKG